MQNYLIWALIAMIAYSFVPVLSKLAEMDMPMLVVALVANVIVVIINVFAVAYLGDWGVTTITHRSIAYALVAGVFLGVAVVSYFVALSLGPVSIVVPIFGLFLVFSAMTGFVILDEPLSARTITGLALALAAIYLTAS